MTVEVEVSWPANISVITWSRISGSVKRSPASPRAPTQQAEDVAAAAVGVGAAAGDLLVDDPVEDLPRGDHLAPGRARAAQQAQGEVDAEEAERALEVLGRGGALAAVVGVEAEQRPHRDPHRQPAHPGVDVDHGVGAQARRSPPPPRSTIAAVEASTCSRWKAGSMIARARSWYSSSIVSRPSPSSGIRSPKLDSRQWKFSGMADGDVVVGLRAEHEDDLGVEQPHA